jgi:RNA polymerase sigma factor (sigma-70 family)
MMPESESNHNRWFAEEVQPHEAQLRGWLRSKFPALEDVDDLIHDAYVKVLNVRQAAPERLYATKSFLFTVARNLALDRLRRRNLIPFDPLLADGVDAVVEDLPGVAESVGRRQELEILAEAIGSLPPRCREVLIMRKVYGWSQKEIAERLNISENTVETQVRTGVRKCTELLAQYGLP